MQLEQRIWLPREGWRLMNSDGADAPALVIFFAAPGTIDDGARYNELKAFYPQAAIIGCTTGGEITDTDVHDGSIVATAIAFKQTRLAFAETSIGGTERGSFEAGMRLGGALPREGLRGVFLLSDGTRVNGTELVAGIQHVLGPEVMITGGLAGDGPSFVSTRVGLNANPETGKLAAVGFYGAGVRLGYGSVGGWDAVGPERLVTRSSGNTLFDLDNLPALDLYKKYLGPEAANLPASALLCPLRIHPVGKPQIRPGAHRHRYR